MIVQKGRREDRLFRVGSFVGRRVCAATVALEGRSFRELWFKLALFYAFIKGWKTYQAIRVLWHQGFREDCVILCRSLFELNLQAEFLVKDPIRHTRMFVAHEDFAMSEWYREIRRVGSKALRDQFKGTARRAARLRKKAARFRNTYHGNRHNWWGSSIKDLVKNSSPTLQEFYLIMYGQQSALVHPTPGAIRHYFTKEHGTIIVNNTPAEQQPHMAIDSVPPFATGFLLALARLVAEGFKRPLLVKAIDQKSLVAKRIITGEAS